MAVLFNRRDGRERDGFRRDLLVFGPLQSFPFHARENTGVSPGRQPLYLAKRIGASSHLEISGASLRRECGWPCEVGCGLIREEVSV